MVTPRPSSAAVGSLVVPAYDAGVGERIAFFEPVHGIVLTVAAGSGRSWMDLPGGDPVHAHCRVDVPADLLLAGSDARPSSGTLFVTWAGLLRFADELTSGSAVLGDRATSLRVRRRRDGRLRAETTFTQGHHVSLTLRCQTPWTGTDPAALAATLRRAVERVRPPAGPA